MLKEEVEGVCEKRLNNIYQSCGLFAEILLQSTLLLLNIKILEYSILNTFFTYLSLLDRFFAN